MCDLVYRDNHVKTWCAVYPKRSKTTVCLRYARWSTVCTKRVRLHPRLFTDKTSTLPAFVAERRRFIWLCLTMDSARVLLSRHFGRASHNGVGRMFRFDFRRPWGLAYTSGNAKCPNETFRGPIVGRALRRAHTSYRSHAIGGRGDMTFTPKS